MLPVALHSSHLTEASQKNTRNANKSHHHNRPQKHWIHHPEKTRREKKTQTKWESARHDRTQQRCMRTASIGRHIKEKHAVGYPCSAPKQPVHHDKGRLGERRSHYATYRIPVIISNKFVTSNMLRKNKAEHIMTSLSPLMLRCRFEFKRTLDTYQTQFASNSLTCNEPVRAKSIA